MEYDISDMDDPSVGYPYSWRSSFHTGCHCNPKKTLPRQNPRHVAHVRLGGEDGCTGRLGMEGLLISFGTGGDRCGTDGGLFRGWAGTGFWMDVLLCSFSIGILYRGLFADAAGVAGKAVNCKSVVDCV